MTDNLENKKAIKDVQATSDEAERLLASLESEQKDEDSTLLRQKSFNKPKSASPATSIDAKTTDDPSGCIGVGILLFGIFLLVALANYSQQTISQSDDTDKLPPTVIKPKIEKMNASQKRFYEKTIAKANNAVLKREHESAIMSLETLKSGKYKALVDVDKGLINNKIIQARKQIKFLDQPGDTKYWETSNYGAQWFDENPPNQFKLFFAYSRKCKSPVITFGFMRTSNGPILDTHTIRPSKYLSTLYVPLKLNGRQTVTLDKFKCN